MKPAEIRELSNEDLVVKTKEAREELFNLRFQNVTGQLENPQKMKELKKDIARVKTVIRENELKG